jgi:hypothetical protein
MLRHSQSRSGQLVIYNEREGGFIAESGHPFLIKRGSATIAEVGQPLEYFVITDEKKRTGTPVSSTRIKRIEIRRGLETAIRLSAPEQESDVGFQNIAEALKDAAGGRKRSS